MLECENSEEELFVMSLDNKVTCERLHVLCNITQIMGTGITASVTSSSVIEAWTDMSLD